MQRHALFKYLVYYPVTLAKGELVALHLPAYRRQQYHSPSDLLAFQATHLLRLLKHASRHSAHYRGHLDSAIAALSSGSTPQAALALVPYLTKADLISGRHNLTTRNRFWSSKKTTGGSTGEPVTLSKNPDALARERAATWRSYEWAGISIGDVQARFWGLPHTRSARLKAKITDALSNRFRISAFDLKSTGIARHYDRLRSRRPDYLYGYVSAIVALADHMLRHSLAPVDSVRAVITTSEILSDADRSLISSAFRSPVFNEYGCGEVGSIAHECERRSLHTMSDNLIIEIDRRDSSADSGEIVVTDLFNFATPLIRYRLGDYVTAGDTDCPCGRTLPTIGSVRGRAYDLVHLKSGEIMHPEALMYILEAIQQDTGEFRQFQVVQEDIDSFTVRIVPHRPTSEKVAQRIQRDFAQRISASASVSVVEVGELPREPSGKMRVVKSLVPQIR